MKKLLFAIFLLISTATFSQSVWSFGLKGGANLSFAHAKNVGPLSASITAGTRAGFYAGGFIQLSPGDSDNAFKLQLEAVYNYMNANFPTSKIAQGPINDKLNVQQISIPVLARIFVIPTVSIDFGPTFNVNLTGKQTFYDRGSSSGLSTTLGKDNLTPFQLGGLLGASYYVYKGLYVQANYNYLFGHINNTKDGKDGFRYLNPSKVKWNDAQVGIGYTF